MHSSELTIDPNKATSIVGFRSRVRSLKELAVIEPEELELVASQLETFCSNIVTVREMARLEKISNLQQIRTALNQLKLDLQLSRLALPERFCNTSLSNFDRIGWLILTPNLEQSYNSLRSLKQKSKIEQFFRALELSQSEKQFECELAIYDFSHNKIVKLIEEINEFWSVVDQV